MIGDEYAEMARQILYPVARLIGAPPGELRLDRPGMDSNSSWATVYWQAWYVCRAHIKGGALTLHGWASRWQDIANNLKVEVDNA